MPPVVAAEAFIPARVRAPARAQMCGEKRMRVRADIHRLFTCLQFQSTSAEETPEPEPQIRSNVKV